MARGYTRRQLKEDRFADAAADTLHWTVEHRRSLIIAGLSAAIVLGALLGWWFYSTRRDARASLALGQAMRTYQAQLMPPGQAPQPGLLAFGSPEDRARAAQQAFQEVAEEYGGTRSGQWAQYFAGVTALELNDTAGAETIFSSVAEGRDADLASLARMGLASVYRATERPAEALEVYGGLLQSSAPVVPRVNVQLEMAETYEAMERRDEARRIYEEIRTTDPASTAAQVANMRLQLLQ